MENKNVSYINPDNMMKPQGFTQVISVKGLNKTIYIGGQDSVDKDGNIIGKDNIKEQAQQILSNIEKALKSAGAKLENIIKWNVYVKQGQSPMPAFEVFQDRWGDKPNPPAITLLYVAGLAHPDYLMEMDAIAIIPE
ncbi:MAG: RidA family protein [Clostridia bacterium]|nr:RidA family protein [Clostridia bacterium]